VEATGVGTATYRADMKQCPRCGASKTAAEFNRSARSGDGLQSYCRDCQKAHYRDNGIRHRRNAKRTRVRRRAEMRQLVFASLAGGCVDCGITDIRVLDFDHVRGIKRSSVSDLVRIGAGIERVLDEIAKCDVRCRNCHAIATMERLSRTWHDRFVPRAT
jgi:hypothetical protein